MLTELWFILLFSFHDLCLFLVSGHGPRPQEPLPADPQADPSEGRQVHQHPGAVRSTRQGEGDAGRRGSGVNGGTERIDRLKVISVGGINVIGRKVFWFRKISLSARYEGA